MDPDELSLWVDLLPEGDGAVVLNGSRDEGGAGALHPAAAGDAGLIVQQHLLKGILTLRAGEEAPGSLQVTSPEALASSSTFSEMNYFNLTKGYIKSQVHCPALAVL